MGRGEIFERGGAGESGVSRQVLIEIIAFFVSKSGAEVPCRTVGGFFQKYHKVILYDMKEIQTMASSFTLGPHFEGFVKEMVSSGRYASASEVVRDGLRLMEDREKNRAAKLAALRAEIAQGLDSGAGEALDMAEIKATARRQRQRARTAATHGQ
jgi:antitoxin ParD1/3/4